MIARKPEGSWPTPLPCHARPQILVPTVDTTRYGALLSSLLAVGRGVLLTGPSGVGKSALVHGRLAQMQASRGQREAAGRRPRGPAVGTMGLVCVASCCCAAVRASMHAHVVCTCILNGRRCCCGRAAKASALASRPSCPPPPAPLPSRHKRTAPSRCPLRPLRPKRAWSRLSSTSARRWVGRQAGACRGWPCAPLRAVPLSACGVHDPWG